MFTSILMTHPVHLDVWKRANKMIGWHVTFDHHLAKRYISSRQDRQWCWNYSTEIYIKSQVNQSDTFDTFYLLCFTRVSGQFRVRVEFAGHPSARRLLTIIFKDVAHHLSPCYLYLVQNGVPSSSAWNTGNTIYTVICWRTNIFTTRHGQSYPIRWLWLLWSWSRLVILFATLPFSIITWW